MDMAMTAARLIPFFSFLAFDSTFSTKSLPLADNTASAVEMRRVVSIASGFTGIAVAAITAAASSKTKKVRFAIMAK